ncbi:hypothetical protein F4824DRAFT_462584 [Ustulina deusta]|nr:hypothetical protein F4824DRAFT_462584 [Ustulina deusta]
MEQIADSMTPLTARDLRNVFAYSQAQATVITLLNSQSKLVEEKCITEDDWDMLITKKLPSIRARDGDSGFVLLIAPRKLENTQPKPSKSATNLSDEEKESPQIGYETAIFENEESLGCGGQRLTRVLPFSQDLFSRIAKAFYTHRSISPAINRADVPLFSHEEVFVQDGLHPVKARIYNCRSTNAWGSDLAMSVTHFPHCRLSFGIIFGCTDSQKKYIRQRLDLSVQQSAHPLLLPGIFVEIERQRHHVIFESGITKLESMIPESDMQTLLSHQQSGEYSNGQDKRTVYLDMLHLKHNLITWSQQLKKMLEHALSLNTEYLGAQHQADSVVNGLEISRDLSLDQETMARMNARIIRRVDTILEDYSDKIRECQTRFDSLTMTTQLFQGETSVVLALGTSQDSRHMRTIALVTMLFLPGTFFATIFSMTFFNWQANDGEATVSSLLWVYIVFTVVSTAATLLTYYYAIALRPKKTLGSAVGL